MKNYKGKRQKRKKTKEKSKGKEKKLLKQSSTISLYPLISWELARLQYIKVTIISTTNRKHRMEKVYFCIPKEITPYRGIFYMENWFPSHSWCSKINPLTLVRQKMKSRMEKGRTKLLMIRGHIRACLRMVLCMDKG